MKKIYIENLGCPKNIVDSERLLGVFYRNNLQETKNPEEAQIAIINTCGFIEASREESIDTIFDFIDLKKANLEKLIVTGCLVESNEDELRREIPEIDYIINLRRLEQVFDILEFEKEDEDFYYNNRILLNNKGYAYLKVSEGCNKKCSFCTIPLFKGRLVSRTIPSLMKEAQMLVEKGINEIILIAQDLTEYGQDININLNKLFIKLNKIENLNWIRLLYTYPTSINDEMIDIIKDSNKICKYIDVPLQHMDDNILKKMNRKGNRKDYYKLIDKLRNRIPDIVIRSTFIVGFPGETEKEFNNLYKSLEELKLDRVGVFSYSYEEDTESSKFNKHVNNRIKEERRMALMELQEKISQEKLVNRINKVYEVLIEDKVETKGNEMPYYLSRSEFEAPEIDGSIVIRDRNLKIGEFYKVKIIDSYTHDLLGVILNK